MDGLPSDEIIRIVKEIQNSKLSVQSRQTFFRKKYNKFAERYSSLFEMACRPDLEMDKLEYMIRLRDRVNSGKTTLENASKNVGQRMFDEYVKPLVNEPPSIEGDYAIVEDESDSHNKI